MPPFSFTDPASWAPKSDSSVAELQRVLKVYVQLTGYAPADPGTVDGLVGLRTVTAVIAMIPRVPGLPAELRAIAPVLTLMLATDDGKKQAFDLVKKNAGTISKAIIGLQIYQVGSQGGSPGTTPTTTSIKNGMQHAGALLAISGMQPPASSTSGGTVPTNPTTTIWFYDMWTRTFRVAVPRGTLGGFTDYVEVAPAASRPNFGTEVSRGAFMSATGRWWGSPLGMAAIAVGVIGGGYVAYRVARALL